MHPNNFCPNELVPSESFGRPAMSGDVQFSSGTGVSLATEGLTGARASGGAWRGGTLRPHHTSLPPLDLFKVGRGSGSVKPVGYGLLLFVGRILLFSRTHRF